MASVRDATVGDFNLTLIALRLVVKSSGKLKQTAPPCRCLTQQKKSQGE